MTRRRRLAAATAGLLGASGALEARAAEALPPATSVVATLEELRLPGREAMGLFGSGLLFEAAPGWWAGPMLYGAITGQRGGLFTWGLEAQRRWRLAPRWQAVAGFYAGGGGGATAPVGSGLMLRPHVGLQFDVGGWWLGLSASQVRFPSGDIDSTQLGLTLAVPDRLGHGRGADVGRLHPDGVSLFAGRYAQANTDGGAGTIGLRVEQTLSPYATVFVQGVAAASGRADGYAEFGVGLQALWPATGAPLRMGALAMAGMSGGGAVSTGGGVIARAGLLARWSLGADHWLDLEGGRTRAVDGDFNTGYLQLGLGTRFGTAPRPAAHREGDEAGVALQTYRAQRRDGRRASLLALGLTYRRALDAQFYASLQAWGAIGGGAGAYSVGLVGAGWRRPLGTDWSAGVEGHVGAAGGGGVSSRGGAIVQPGLWLARDLGLASRVRAGIGYVRSVRGDLSSPVAELAWSVRLDAL